MKSDEQISAILRQYHTDKADPVEVARLLDIGSFARLVDLRAFLLAAHHEYAGEDLMHDVATVRRLQAHRANPALRHSAKISIILRLANGRDYAVASMGPHGLMIRDPNLLPRCHGTLAITIDGQVDEREVFLPDGMVQDGRWALIEKSRITIDPGICHGQPCIRGLRYPVAMLADLMTAEGESEESILREYPELEPGDLAQVRAFAK